MEFFLEPGELRRIGLNPFHGGQGLAQSLNGTRRHVDDGESHHVGFDYSAHHQEVERARLGSNTSGRVIGGCLTPHEAAAPGTPAYEAMFLEYVQRLANRVPGDAEFTGQCSFRGQSLVGRVLLGAYSRQQRVYHDTNRGSD